MNEEAQVEVEDSGVVTEGGDPLLVNPDIQERPEWLPEKFKSPEDLAAAYGSLEGKLGKKEEELKASFMEEIEKEAYANRPETKGDYVLPDGIDEVAAPDNPLLNWWADHAFENGFGQDEFQQGIQMYIDAMAENIPDYDAEFQSLGDNAAARTEAASLFANQFFPEDQLPAIERLCETADGIKVLEHIMENMREAGPSSTSTPVQQISEGDLKSMMMDDRYHNPAKRDPEFVKMVEQGFKKIYG